MLKKITALIAALMLVCIPALAEGALVISGNAMIDGDTVYYSGSIDSVEMGVYRMTATGAGASRLYEGVMTLLEAENGNVLAISYDEPDSEYALVVMNALGEKTIVSEDYVDHAIAADGRFYWGVGSCGIDGSDARVLIDDKDHSYNYYPLAVQDGMYYYLDWAENSERFRAYANAPGKPERYPMFHITSPGRLIPEGISIEDLYLPIKER